MVMQGLPPGMQYRDEADLGAEMFRPAATAQRLGRRLEQDGVDHGLVLEGDLSDRRRQREDDMEVRHGQQLGLPGGEPCGARPALTFLGNAGCGRNCRRCGPARRMCSIRCGRPAPPSEYEPIALITRRSTRPRCPAWIARQARCGGGRRPPLPAPATWRRRVRRAAPPPASGGRAGSPCADQADRDLRVTPCSTGCCAPAAPE